MERAAECAGLSRVEFLAELARRRVDERARLLAGFGFGPLDALHLALAEKAEARWFVTTDDRLFRKAFERRDQMSVAVVRPDQLTLDQENEP